MGDKIEKTIVLRVDASGAVTSIEEVKDALNETQENLKKVENTNLGNVSKKFGDLTDKFKQGEIGLRGFAKGVLGVGKSLMTVFITNPILLAVTALVGVFVGLFNLFKNFAPVVDKVEQIFARLQARWEVLKSGLIGLISGNKSLKETFVGLGDAMNEAADAAERLKKEEQDLDDIALALSVSNKKAQTQIQELMLQSRNRSLSEKERIALLEKAQKLEDEQFLKNKEFAKREAELAFGKLTNGKITGENAKQELEFLKQIGTAEADRVKDQYNLNDEQYKIWIDKLNAQEDVEQQSIALQEKAQNQKDALLEKQKVDQERIDAERIAKAEEQAAKEKSIRDQYYKDIESRARMHQKELEFIEKGKQLSQLDDEKEVVDVASDYAMKKFKETNDFKYSYLTAQLENGKISEQEYFDEVTKMGKEAAEKQKAADDEMWNNRQQKAQQAFDTAFQLESIITNAALANQNKKLKNGKVTQEQYDKAVADIERKSARRKKALAIAEALVQTALGVAKAIPNPFLMAFAGIAGAAAVATILATPIESSGGASAPNVPAAPSVPESTTSGPNTSFTFAARTGAGATQNVSKTYVTSIDVQKQTQLDRQVVANGTIN